jgi:hypothetical protein
MRIDTNPPILVTDSEGFLNLSKNLEVLTMVETYRAPIPLPKAGTGKGYLNI